LRNNEITMLEHINTKMTAAPMPRPFMTEVVTAREGHIPSNRTNKGFSLIIPAVKTEPRL